MSEAKAFGLGTVLSVLGNKMVCPIGEVYEILNHLTGDNLFTHQLPRAIREVRPYLRQCFPDLATIDDSMA